MNHKHSQSWWAVGLVIILLSTLPWRVEALWAMMPPVPLARLVQNTRAYLRQHPNHARAHYVLGRLHSLAYATGQKQGQVFTDANDPLPQFPGNQPILTPRTTKVLTKEGQAQLLASIQHYQQATKLDSKLAVAFLGLAWVLEDGAVFAEKVDPFPQEKKPEGKRAYWQAKALAAYRQAYQLTVAADLKLEGLGPEATPAISLEAGRGVIRLLQLRKPSAPELEEIARIEKTNAAIEEKPRAVTPIIFPLEQPAPLSSLLNKQPVRFDLAGDGKPSWWPWVKPEVGILVWNPRGTGRITSGLQLFGSVTWWIAWENGYAPLAMLDDDGDGWLRGKEFQGLAVWRDANSNGVSEAGEVLSLAQANIERIAVQPQGNSEQVPYHPQGIRLHDGRWLPTYDWTPREIKRCDSLTLTRFNS